METARNMPVCHPIPAPVKDRRNAAADPAANQIVVSPTVISSITRRITTSKSQIILIVSGVRASTCHTSLRQMSFRIRKDGDGSFSKLSPLFLIF